MARTAGVPGGRWSTVTRDGGISAAPLRAPPSPRPPVGPPPRCRAASGSRSGRRPHRDTPRAAPLWAWSTTSKSAISGPATGAVVPTGQALVLPALHPGAVAGEVGGCVGAGIGQVPRRPQHPTPAVARCDGAPIRRRPTGQRPRGRPVRPGSGRRRWFHDENLDGPPLRTRSPGQPGPSGGSRRLRGRRPRPGTLAPGPRDLPRCPDGAGPATDPDGPRALQPLPGGDRGAGAPGDRTPRPGVPRRPRRDLRPPPDGVRHDQRAHPPGQRDGVGGDGGVLRERRPARRPGRRRGERGVRRADVRGGDAASGPRWCGSTPHGAGRSTPRRCWAPTPPRR